MFLVKHKAGVHNIIINALSRRKNLLLKFHDGGLLGHLVRTQRNKTCIQTFAEALFGRSQELT